MANLVALNCQMLNFHALGNSWKLTSSQNASKLIVGLPKAPNGGPKGPLPWYPLGSKGFPPLGGPGPPPMGCLGLPRVPTPMPPMPLAPSDLGCNYCSNGVLAGGREVGPQQLSTSGPRSETVFDPMADLPSRVAKQNRFRGA